MLRERGHIFTALATRFDQLPGQAALQFRYYAVSIGSLLLFHRLASVYD